MPKILDTINKPEDLKGLNIRELYKLADEIRELIIDTVSENGGHLASNLGAVELTLALNRVFDFSVDRIIWDVGHQSYTQKILSERKDRFNTLRKEGGISGFPKTQESIYDAFNTGHSSTSVSAAIGMARARDLRGEKYKICAVIGDGALTGGMAFEGLNDMGQCDNQVIVILNDNEMAINKNVGGLSKYLNRIASKPGYNKFKKGLRARLIKIPKVGEHIIDYLGRMKNAVKHLFQQNVIFDDLGIKYIGPVNGHDINEMIQAMERAEKIDGPVVLHVKTVKGMGYKPAENRPEEFHGIAPFDIPSGEVKVSNQKTSNSICFSKKLCKLAESNGKITAITAAMPHGTGLNLFQKKYPERFFDVGIAEQHAVTMAAGMAISGIIPCVAVYSTFLQRAYDQLLHDVALQNLHVVFGVDRAGVVGDDGETHQGIYDISFFNTLPNFTVMAPASLLELEQMLEYAINKVDGPVAVRYPRKVLPDRTGYEKEEFSPRPEILKTGSDVTFIAVGDMLSTVQKTCKILEENGRSSEIINLKTVKPLDPQILIESAEKTKFVVTVENNIIDGGVGEKILCLLDKAVPQCRVEIMAIPNEPVSHASIEQIMKRYGLDPESIADKIGNML